MEAAATAIENRDAEIERLRDEAALRIPYKEMARGLEDRLREQANEIERLRGAYEQERKDRINLTEKVIPNLRDEIERLRKELEGADRVANGFAQTACKRGARMQIMREWMLDRELNGCDAAIAWWAFVEERPETGDWFYEDGTPR